MQLTDDQIQYLFQFTRKKSVHWYDLQIELVDHLASRIEEEMNADISLGFDAALEKVYKGFGISGFSKIVQEKSGQLQRIARKIWWHEIVAFFTWPKIILLALVITVLWQLPLLFDPSLLMIVFLVLYLLTSERLISYLFRIPRVRQKLLLLQLGTFHNSTVIPVYNAFIIFRIFIDYNYFSALEFCILSTVGILIKVASLQLYVKVKEKAIKLYPEAFA